MGPHGQESPLRKQLSEIQSTLHPKESTEYLTRHEVASMLKCDLSTVHSWPKKGKLIPYGMGNRVYYKKVEIETNMVAMGKTVTGTNKKP